MARTGQRPTGRLASLVRGNLLEAAVLSSVFYLVLFAILELTDATELTAEHVLIALVPLLILLVSSDRIEELRAGSFTMALRRAAESHATPAESETIERVRPADEDVDVDRATVLTKGTPVGLSERLASARTPPSTLAFRLHGPRYDRDAIEEYLRTNVRVNPAFRYVLFTGDDDRFAGLIRAQDFETLVRDAPGGVDVVDQIRTGDVLDHPRVTRATLREGATKRDALAAMDAADTDLLAVVDDHDRFVGALTQAEITRDLLLKLVSTSGA